jgi:anti-sigma B factor antagonist
MSAKISRREIGDVTILDVAGRITLGEGSTTLRDAIRDEISNGRSRLLLNLSEVNYIDSSGVFELVSAFTKATSSGGMTRLLNLTKRVQDLLQITKLYTVFEVFDDEAEALQSFHCELRYCCCPICQRMARPPQVPGETWKAQFCPNCLCRFTVMSGEQPERESLIAGAQIQTYENEYLQIEPGAPFTVRIVGRLDPFLSTHLARMWKALPAPRRVLFDLSSVTESGPAGAKVLLALLATRNQDDRAAVSFEGLPPALLQYFPSGPDVVATKADALRALGNVSGTPKWTARVGRFRK